MSRLGCQSSDVHGFSLVFTHTAADRLQGYSPAEWHRHVAEGSSSLAHTWLPSNILGGRVRAMLTRLPVGRRQSQD